MGAFLIAELCQGFAGTALTFEHFEPRAHTLCKVPRVPGEATSGMRTGPGSLQLSSRCPSFLDKDAEKTSQVAGRCAQEAGREASPFPVSYPAACRSPLSHSWPEELPPRRARQVGEQGQQHPGRMSCTNRSTASPASAKPKHPQDVPRPARRSRRPSGSSSHIESEASSLMLFFPISPAGPVIDSSSNST